MTNFTDFVKNKALSDRLPFGVNFEFSQVESSTTEVINGLEIKTQCDLTVGESWFMELIQDFNQANLSEYRLLFRVLADKLNKAMGLDDIQKASEYLLVGNVDWVDNDDYLAFSIANKDDTDRFQSLYRLLKNDVGSDMLLITFFMKTRHNIDWSMGQTASLPLKTLRAIKDLMIKESNGGVMPSEDVADESEEESTEDGEGK